MNDIRCVECREEFDSTQLTDDVVACPNCGTTSLPVDITKQQTWALTFPEWAELLFQAELWERAFRMAEPTTVRALRDVIFASDIANEHGEHPVVLSPDEIRILTYWASNQILSVLDAGIDQQLAHIMFMLRGQSYEPIFLDIHEELEALNNYDNNGQE